MSSPAPLISGQVAMYEEFYRFSQPPFTLAPDPRFLYRSESHAEAITGLKQAIRRREGLIVLSGDIGTGKTTICRALLHQLDVNTFTSLVLNPFLSAEELLREILFDFGVVSREAMRSGRISGASKHELIRTLEEFLLSLHTIRGSGVLIIDEAQHLSPEVLEEIRIISNLETNDSKLLQVVLVGQLNLLDTLADYQMRQVNQRISLRAVLKPLTREEVEAYIGHRLKVAKGTESVSFEDAALDEVHAFTGGVPRVINLLCDRALMLGADQRVNVVTPELIHDAADKLQLQSPHLARRLMLERARRWGIAAAAAVLVVAAILLFAPLYRLVSIIEPTLPTAPRFRVGAPLAQPLPPTEPSAALAPTPVTRPLPAFGN